MTSRRRNSARARLGSRIFAACVTAASGACRLGGPEEVPAGPAPVGAASAVDASVAAPSEEAEAPRGAADASVEAGDLRDGARDEASDAVVPDGPQGEGCVAAVPSDGCDPVCNTGCATLSRCDVGDAPRSGRCIGIWIGREGDLCSKTSLTDTCAPKLTCHAGRCLRLCYRDSDCENGACCTVSVDASGFMGCAKCAP